MIIVTGSIAFDNIMNFPGKFSDQIIPEKIHQINLSFMVDTLREGYGGTAGNISYNLGLLGEKPVLLATAGKDFSEYKKYLKKNGVETKFVKVLKDDFSAKAFITTDLADNQITGFYPGALKMDKKLSLKGIAKVSDFVVVSPTNPEAMENFTKECIENKVPFMFDPGMQLPRLTEKILIEGVLKAKILIGNDYEISLLKKKVEEKIWEQRDPQQILIITLGEKGAIIELRIKNPALTARLDSARLAKRGEQELRKIKISPAKPNEVLDPTGAGDAFRAGFIAGYLRGFSLEVCGKMGNLGAVYTVEKYGTQTHNYTISQFCERYEENYKEKLNL